MKKKACKGTEPLVKLNLMLLVVLAEKKTMKFRKML